MKQADHHSTADNAAALSPAGRLGVRFAQEIARHWPLWRQFRLLSLWLENEAFPAIERSGHNTARLEVTVDGVIRLRGHQQTSNLNVPPTRRIATMLQRAGVRYLHLETRLESNQIVDILTLLRVRRRWIQAHDAGVQYACATTRIVGETLSIQYSYCVTCLSRMVHWFERSHQRFADHRTLFRAAPRYALLAGGIALAPLAALWAGGDGWPLVTATAAAATLEFALVYLSLMTIGSVEYDNEEKAHNLSAAYDRLDSYSRHIADDLSRARLVQQRIIPDADAMPLREQIRWATCFDPVDEVGGDSFDAMTIAPGRVAILFSDVSGHGMAAAMLTAVLKTAFRSWLDEGGDLGEFVARLNRRLLTLAPDDSFAAAFVAVYDARTRVLSYVNGGHNPEPWLIPADNEAPLTDLCDARAMLLGVAEDIPIRPAATTLADGDTIVFVTDGVTEAEDLDGCMYGRERLEALLNDCRGATPEAIVERIIGDVRQFSHGVDQADDQTILAFQIAYSPERTGPSEASITQT